MRKKIVFVSAALLAASGIIGGFSKQDLTASAEGGHASHIHMEMPESRPTPRRPAKFGQPASLDEDFNGTKIIKSEAAWKKRLTAKQFYVLRQKGTEPAFEGLLTDNKASGTYYCVACGLRLFSSKNKYDSQTGWPSFYQPISKGNVAEEVDNSEGETRTEILCSRCDSHLGHVFDDGPEPTGLRYCINSVALKFVKGK